MQKNRNILIISHELWSTGYISKHHYAIEFSKRGYNVYFMELPNQERSYERGKWIISNSVFNNLFIVKLRMAIPLIWFDKFKFGYMLYIKYKLHEFEKKIEGLKAVINFDSMDYFPLRYFKSQDCKKFFFPVDKMNLLTFSNTSKNCDLVITVAEEITRGIFSPKQRVVCFNHGVCDDFFISNNNKGFPNYNSHKIKVGYSGNLFQKEVDRSLLMYLIAENPMIEFHFFGNYLATKNDSDEIVFFIKFLIKSKNVTLHGLLTKTMLPNELLAMDICLVCYDNITFPYHSWNSHKFLEYLALGKPVLSTYLSRYGDMVDSDLVLMCQNTTEYFDCYVEKFNYFIAHKSFYSNEFLEKERIELAKEYQYSKLCEKIDLLISN